MFKQHIPPMVTTDAPPFEFSFETADELLAHPWIAEWKDEPGFERYSVSPYTDYTSLLMVEFSPRDPRFWVLGYLGGGDPQALGLPPFRHAPPEAAP